MDRKLLQGQATQGGFKNDSPAKSELQTANIRGRISMCKEILGLAENKKVDVEPPKREIY
jgi:hypothetical protein